MRGQKRSPEDIECGLQALAESGGNAEAASRASGIPANTLRTWKASYSDEFVELRREKRTGFIDDVWEAAREALAELRGKLETMKGKDVAVTFGILTDKALILGGEPDTISETRIRGHRSELDRKLREAVATEAEGGVSEEPDR